MQKAKTMMARLILMSAVFGVSGVFADLTLSVLPAKGVPGSQQTVTVNLVYTDTNGTDAGFGGFETYIGFSTDAVSDPTNIQLGTGLFEPEDLGVSVQNGRLKVEVLEDSFPLGDFAMITTDYNGVLFTFDVTVKNDATVEDSFTLDVDDSAASSNGSVFHTAGGPVDGQTANFTFTDGAFGVVLPFVAEADAEDVDEEDDWTEITLLTNDKHYDPVTGVELVTAPTMIMDALSGNANDDDPGDPDDTPADWSLDQDEDGNLDALATDNGQVQMVDDVVQYKPDADFFGTDYFWYAASAGTAPNEYDSYALVTITVDPVNDVPSFTVGGANVPVNEDSGAYNSAFITDGSAGPANEQAQILSYTVNVPVADQALFAGDGQPAISAIGTLSFTPAADAFGSTTVSVTLKDNGLTTNGGGDTAAPQTFTITITGVNDAPEFSSGGNVTGIAEDAGPQTKAAWATGIAVDPDGDPTWENNQTPTFTLTVTGFTPNNAPGFTKDNCFSTAPAVDGATGNLTFEFEDDVSGTATVSITLSDGTDATNPVEFDITVTPANDAPVLTGTPTALPTYIPAADDNGTPVLPPDFQNIVADVTGVTAGDVDDDALTPTYTWHVIHGDGSDPELLKTGSLTFDYSVDDPNKKIALYDQLKFTYTAEDATLTSNEVSVMVAIGNQPPALTWTINPLAPVEGDLITITVDADDTGHMPNPDDVTAMTIEVDNTDVTGDATVTNDGLTGQLIYTIQTDNNTSPHGADTVYSVSVTATDAANSQVTETKDITVTDDNETPVISGTSGPGAAQGGAYTFTPTVTDDDNEDTEGHADYALVNPFSATMGGAALPGDSWLEFDAATGTLSSKAGRPTNADVGDYSTIVISFTDGAPETVALGQFDLTVTNLNDDPVAADDGAVGTEFVTTDEDTTAPAIAVLTGDTDDDVDNGLTVNDAVDTLTVSTSGVSTKGASLTTDGTTVDYNPNGKFENLSQGATTTDTFDYTITDNANATSTATVTVKITGVNDDPVVTKPKIAANAGASLSKPDATGVKALTSLTASGHVVTDADDDDNDINGEFNRTITYTWKLTRKVAGVQQTYTLIDDVADADTLANNAVYAGSGIKTTDTTTNTAVDAGGVAETLIFEKDDKVEVAVKAEDSQNATYTARKSVTLGNPAWLPGLEWDGVNDAEDYQVQIKDGDNLIVTLYVIDPVVKSVNYLQSRNWVDDPSIKGLEPGDYTVEVTPSFNGLYDAEDKFTVVLDEVEYDSQTADAVPIAAPATAQNLTQLQDDQAAAIPGAYFDDVVEVFKFFGRVTDAAAYRVLVENVLTGAALKDFEQVIGSATDGVVATEADVMVTVPVTEVGTYSVELYPLTPDAPDGIEEVVNRADVNLIKHRWEFAVDAAEVVDPTDKTPTGYGSTSAEDWGMVPGYPGVDTTVIPADGEYSRVDQSGNALVQFSWSEIAWADVYMITVADEYGEQVPGVGYTKVDAPTTTFSVSLPAGKYQWTITGVNANGFTDFSPTMWFWIKASDADELELDNERNNTPVISDITAVDFDADTPNTVTVTCDVTTIAPTQVKAYIVNRSTQKVVFDGLADAAMPAVGNGQQVVVTGLTLLAGDTYTVQLLAVNGDYALADYTDSLDPEATGVAHAVGVVAKAPGLDASDVANAMTFSIDADNGGLAAGDEVGYQVYLLSPDGRIKATEGATLTVAAGETTVVIDLDEAVYGPAANDVGAKLYLILATASADSNLSWLLLAGSAWGQQ